MTPAALAAHLLVFCLLCRRYTLFHATMLQAERHPAVVIYFSPSKPLNEALYVGFYPWVALTVLSRSDVAFAHSGSLLRAAAVQESRDDLAGREPSPWTPGRALAPVVWGGVLLVYIRRRWASGSPRV